MRLTSPLSSRLRAVLVAGAAFVLGASALAAAGPAQATPNVTDLEATILRIGGSAITGSTAIPSGRTLTKVRLTTADPVTSVGDGWIWDPPIAPVRTRCCTFQGSPAEQVTFRIDGTVVATSVPEFRYTYLQTDAGPIGADVFTASGVTYAITSDPVDRVTRTTARSSVGNPRAVFVTYARGVLPVGAQPRVGTALQQSVNGGQPVAGTARPYRVTAVDADDIRRNAGADGEELVFAGEPARSYRSLLLTAGTAGTAGTEELTTVRLRSGATVTVRSLTFLQLNPYGANAVTWLLDRAALAAAGGTVADIVTVVTSVPAGHSATWQDLGLDRV